jgi:hypothetical protein
MSYPNDIVYGGFKYSLVQKNFEPQSGFLQRSDYDKLSMELRYRPRITFIDGVRNLDFKFIDADVFWTEDTGELETMHFEFRPFGFTLRSGDFVAFNIERVYDKVKSEYNLVQNAIIPAGEYDFTLYSYQFLQLQRQKFCI